MDCEDSYDGIVLGAGHNGLITQAYLCRSGLKVLSVDRAEWAGGGLCTVEDPCVPGLFHNLHAVFLRGLSASRWYRDLELESWGLKLLHPELNVSSVQRNGSSLNWYVDAEKTAASVAEVSPADGEAWRQIAREFRPIVDLIVEAELASPPLDPRRRRALLTRSQLGRRFLELHPLSPREFIDRHFKHPQVRALLLYLCLIREVDVREPGQGEVVPALIASQVKAQLAVGGSSMVAQALERDVRAHGGHVMTKATLRRILVERGRATGVELADGRRIRARAFVASSLNPQQTFFELLGGQGLSPELIEHVRNYRYQVVGPLFGVHLALREPPLYRAPEVRDAFLTILGLESPQDVYHLYQHPRSLPERMILWGATPTLHDSSQAPRDAHAAFVWQKVPYALDWDSLKQRHLLRVMECWRDFAPNLTGTNLLNSFVRTPVDTERHLPNMARGDLGVGWLGRGQRGQDRPLPGIPPYRTPVRSLYLCGSATHPGGNITGHPGYNAARVIAEDLGVQPWWNPPNLEESWSTLA